MSNINSDVIIKYIFNNYKDPSLNINYYNLYTSFIKLCKLYNFDINFFKNIGINPEILSCLFDKKGKNDELVIFILYTELLRFSCKENCNKNFLTNDYLSNYTKIYFSNKEYNINNYLDIKNKLVLITILHFNLYINIYTIAKEYISNDEMDEILKIDELSKIEDIIIKKIFKKKRNFIDINLDNNLVVNLMGLPLNIINKYSEVKVFRSCDDFYKIKNQIIDKIILNKETVFSEKILDRIIKISSENIPLGHIFTKFINRFIENNKDYIPMIKRKIDGQYYLIDTDENLYTYDLEHPKFLGKINNEIC